MMDYEIFKDVIEDQIKDYLPDSFKNADILIRRAHETNESYDEICAILSDEKMSPAVGIKYYYEKYREKENIQSILKELAGSIVELHDIKKEVEDIVDLDNVQHNILYAVVNTEANREFLENAPHRQLHDLSVVYRIRLGNDEYGKEISMKINNDIMNKMELTEQNLFDLASENTNRIYPAKAVSMEEQIREILQRQGMDNETIDVLVDARMLRESPLWVVKNDAPVGGAAIIANTDVFDELSQKIGDDLYIIPSSVHEVLVMPAGQNDALKLADMVLDINRTETLLADRLSNQIYKYDKENKEITMATDTPNKSIEYYNSYKAKTNDLERKQPKDPKM